jgi:hypothetical protein
VLVSVGAEQRNDIFVVLLQSFQSDRVDDVLSSETEQASFENGVVKFTDTSL